MENLTIDTDNLYKPIPKSNNLFYKAYRDKYVLSCDGNRFLIVNQPSPIRNRLLKVEDVDFIKSVEKIGLKYILHIDTTVKRTIHYMSRINKFELVEVNENDIWEYNLK